MNWLPDTCSTSGDTNVESFGDLDQDNLSFYSYLELVSNNMRVIGPSLFVTS